MHSAVSCNGILLSLLLFQVVTVGFLHTSAQAAFESDEDRNNYSPVKFLPDLFEPRPYDLRSRRDFPPLPPPRTDFVTDFPRAVLVGIGGGLRGASQLVQSVPYMITTITSTILNRQVPVNNFYNPANNVPTSQSFIYSPQSQPTFQPNIGSRFPSAGGQSNFNNQNSFPMPVIGPANQGNSPRPGSNNFQGGIQIPVASGGSIPPQGYTPDHPPITIDNFASVDPVLMGMNQPWQTDNSPRPQQGSNTFESTNNNLRPQGSDTFGSSTNNLRPQGSFGTGNSGSGFSPQGSNSFGSASNFPSRDDGAFGSSSSGASSQGTNNFGSAPDRVPIQGSSNFGGTTDRVPSQGSGNFGGTNDRVPSQGSGNFGGTNDRVPSQGSGNFGGTNNRVPSQGSGNFGGTSDREPSQGSGNFGGPNDRVPSQGSGNFGSANDRVPSQGSGNFGGTNDRVPSQGSGNLGGTNDRVPSQGSGNFGGTNDRVPSQGSNNFGGSENLINGIQDFTLDLIDTFGLPTTEDNIVISPVSISSLLTLLTLATNGNSKHELQRSLHLPPLNSDLEHIQYERILNRLNQVSKGINISTSTRLFLEHRTPIRESFSQKAKDHYNCSVSLENFRNKPAETKDHVNKWVETETQGKITEFISQPFSPDTLFVAANTIYFSGEWETTFPQEQTTLSDFDTGRNVIRVPMMLKTFDTPHYYSPQLNVDITSIPYSGREFSMYIILPREGPRKRSIADVERSLNTLVIENLIRNMTIKTVSLSLPRMRLAMKTSLVDSLSRLGVQSIFSPQSADFSGLSSAKPLYVSEILHEAVMEVTEVGTVAAAASAAGLNRIGGNQMILVNKPAIIFIGDTVNQVPLFWTRLVKPEAL